MGKITGWLSALFAALTIVACAPAQTMESSEKQPVATSSGSVSPVSKPAWEEKWGSTVAAARKEGKVIVVSMVGPETRIALTEAFKSKFGMELEFIIGRAAETIPRVEKERGAGLYLTDVTVDGGRTMIQLKNLGFLEPIDPVLILPEVADPRMWFNNETFYFSEDRTSIGFLKQFNSGVLRNTDLVKEGEVASYSDLLKPQWKDKVVMDDPSVGGAGNNLIGALSFGSWNVDQTSNWLRQMLKEQNVTLSRDPKLEVEWVARGKYLVAVAVWTDQLVKFLEIGAPIAQQRVKEGGFITSSNGGVALYNRPAHPNAAVVFVNWLLSREGQEIFASHFGGPSRRKDVKVEGVYGALAPVEGEKAYEEKTEEQIANRMKLLDVSAQIIAEARR